MHKTCPYCEKVFKTRSSKRKFCSMACYRAWQRDHAKRSEKAKKRRRRELLLKQVRGEIPQEAFDRQWNEFQEEGLI